MRFVFLIVILFVALLLISTQGYARGKHSQHYYGPQGYGYSWGYGWGYSAGNRHVRAGGYGGSVNGRSYGGTYKYEFNSGGNLRYKPHYLRKRGR